MEETLLDKKFKEAVELASATSTKLPPDVMLRFYAYYKQATEGVLYEQPSINDEELRSAFKANARFQVSFLSKDEAKEGYIALVTEYLQ